MLAKSKPDYELFSSKHSRAVMSDAMPRRCHDHSVEYLVQPTMCVADGIWLGRTSAVLA